MAGRWIDKRKEEEEKKKSASGSSSNQVEAAQPKAPQVKSVTNDMLEYAKSKVSTATNAPSARPVFSQELDKPKAQYIKNSGVDEDGKTVYDLSKLSRGGLNDALRSSVYISSASERKNFLSQVEAEGARRTTNAQAMNALSGINLYGLDGSKIDANTADASTVIKGIRLIADDDQRKAAKDAFVTLTKTPGSRFYGMEQGTDSLDSYIESAHLSKSVYDDYVKTYATAFYGDEAHKMQDAETYLQKREEILSQNASAYVQEQLIYALDNAYLTTTGQKEAPKEEQTTAQAEEASVQKKETEEEEKARGFIAGITGQVTQEFEQEQKTTPDTEAPEVQGQVQQETTQEPQSAEVQGPVQQTPTERVGAMGFEEWMQSGMPVPAEQEAQYIEVSDMGDVARAFMRGEYDRIAPEYQEQFDEYLQSPTAQTVLGLFTTSEALMENEGAENIVNRNMGSLGWKAQAVIDMIDGEDFPDELYGLGVMTLVDLAKRADELEQSGQLGGDVQLPLMERLLTTDAYAQEQVENLYSARDELLAEKASILKEEQQKGALALEQARKAVLSGRASDEQRQLVLDSATVYPAQIYSDDSYYTALIEAGSFFAAGDNGQSAYSVSAAARGIAASGVTNDSQYQAALESTMEQIIEEDAYLAHSLGMTLGDYYAAGGGMNMDTMAQRAATRISKQGASITDDEASTLEAPYGEGVGVGTTIGLGIRYGTEEFIASGLESVYYGLTTADIVRTASRMQLTYNQAYGAMGRTVYRRDLLDMANSGTIPEEMANFIKRALMEGGGDIYDIGIDPKEQGFITEASGKASVSIRNNMQTELEGMRTNATEGEFLWFNRIASMTTNAENAITAAAATAITGNAKIGFAIGYSFPDWGRNFQDRLADGYSLQTAKQLASIDTAGMYIANVGTFEGVLGRITGSNALQIFGMTTAAKANASGAMKAIAAVRKNAWGNAVLSGAQAFAQNTLDEAIGDEFKEGLAQRYIDAAIAPIFRKIDQGQEVGASDLLGLVTNVTDVDPLGLAGDVAGNFKEVAITSSLFSLAGAFGSGVTGYRSTRIANAIVQGKTADVESMLSALKVDVEDPVFRAAVDEAARNAKKDKATAENMVFDKGEDGLVSKAAHLKEQADSHQEQATAAKAAMDEAEAIMNDAQARRENGDASSETAQEIIDAGMAYAKNRTGYDEHTREAEQKQAEYEETLSEKLEAARAQAMVDLRAEEVAGRAAIANDAQLRKNDIQSQIEAIDAEVESLNQSLIDAYDMGLDDETLDVISERIGALFAQRDDLETEMTVGKIEDSAVEDARVKEQKELEAQEGAARAEQEEMMRQEDLREEAEQMQPVWQKLKKTPVFVDDSQAAEILYKTGLKNMTQVNSRYGTKFRTNKSKNIPSLSLDGSFYAELTGLSGGRMSADAGHPETAVIDVLDRKMQLESQMQASIGTADMAAYLPAGTVNRGMSAPQTMALASQLRAQTGLELIVAPLADNVRALYDRENGRLVISSRIGVGERAQAATMHEVTHFIENTDGYEAYAQSALEAAYQGDEDAMERDADQLREEYAEAGISLSEDGVYSELVAQATEKLIKTLGRTTGIGSENVVFDLLGKKLSFPVRLFSKLTQFLAKRKAMKSGQAARYEAIQRARDNLKNAIAVAGKWVKKDGTIDPTIDLDEALRARGKIKTDSEQLQMEIVDGSAQAPRQFAIGDRKTVLEKADWMFDEVKEILGRFEKPTDSNRAQFERAQGALQAVGYEVAAKALVSKSEDFTADDNMLGALLMVEAKNRNDLLTQAMIATKLRGEASKQGRDLQSWRAIAKITPEGAMANAINMADAENSKKGIPKGALPVGDEAPKGKRRSRRSTAGTGAGTETETVIEDVPKPLKDLYDESDRIALDLSGLSHNVSWDNRWNLPLSETHMGLIRHFGLENTELAGYDYNRATKEQRQLAAIVASDPDINGDALLALIQQLEGIKRGLSVVTYPDLSYIAAQGAEVLDAEGGQTSYPKTEAGKTALGRMVDAQSNINQSSLIERFNALGYANMLSAPATTIRNIAGNVLIAPMEEISTAIAQEIDKAVSEKTGTRTVAMASREAVSEGNKAFAREMGQTFKDYLITHTDTSHGRKYSVGTGGRTFQPEALETYKNIVEFAMQLGDRPFYEKKYNEELETVRQLQMKIRDAETKELRSMTEEEIRQEASMRALERVFQEDNAVVNIMNDIRRKYPGIATALSLIIPFVKTPTNVARRIFEYTPMGLAKALVWDGLRGMGNNMENFDQRKFVMNVGRGLTGTAIIGAGALLGALGVIRPGREDEENQRRSGIMKAQGKPYSMYIRILGTDHEIDWALPAAAPLAIGANVAWILQESGNEDALSAVVNATGSIMTDGFNMIFDNSMLSSLNDLFRGYDDGAGTFSRFLETSVNSAVSRTLVPSFMRAIVKATDPYVRDTSSQNAIYAALKQNVLQYYPVIRQMLPISTDVTGDKALQSGAWNWGREQQNAVLHMFDALLTPTATTREKNDAALWELTDLSYRTGETAFLPDFLLSSSTYELTINKTTAKKLSIGMNESGEYMAVTISLTDDEKRQLNADYANLLFNGAAAGVKMNEGGIRRLTQSDAWAMMDDESKVKAIEDLKDEAKFLIIQSFVRERQEEGEIL